jgi:hypothetical protein
MMVRTLMGCMLVSFAVSTDAAAQSPYAGQESREIKALSAQDISGYLAGKGLALAKAAELNGYPGPMHVLEFAERLELTPQEKLDTELIFTKMQTHAIRVGADLIEEERALDRLFASRSVNPENLRQALARIGALQTQLRQVHLDAHIEQTELLAPAQVEKYNRLRGYAMAGEHQTHESRRH